MSEVTCKIIILECKNCGSEEISTFPSLIVKFLMGFECLSCSEYNKFTNEEVIKFDEGEEIARIE